MLRHIHSFARRPQGKTSAALAVIILIMACSSETSFKENTGRAPGADGATSGSDPAKGEQVGDLEGKGKGDDANNAASAEQGQDGTLGDGQGGNPNGGGPSGYAGGGTKPTEQLNDGAAVAMACQDAMAKGKLKTVTKDVLFPATTKTCVWNQDGNGAALNAHIRGRVEQSFSLDVPRAARFCDMAFDFPKQTMKYDDEIFLLLQGYVLAASTDYQVSAAYPTGLKSEDGFVKYAWKGDNALYDRFYDHAVTPVYCLGVDPKASGADQACLIPPTEQTGQMKLKIPADKIMALSAKAGVRFNEATTAADKWQLGFVTTGDNDSSDCQHSAFGFTVTVRYLENQ